MLNVCDEPPAVGTSAWSVYPFVVVMDMTFEVRYGLDVLCYKLDEMVH